MEKYGKNITLKKGRTSLLNNDMFNYIEDLFLTDPTLSFKKAYHKFLFTYNLEKDDISY